MTPTENKTVQTFKMTGDWNVQSKQLKNKFSQLTDADLKFEKGKESELIGRVGTRLNKKQDEIITILTKNQEEKN